MDAFWSLSSKIAATNITTVSPATKPTTTGVDRYGHEGAEVAVHG